MKKISSIIAAVFFFAIALNADAAGEIETSLTIYSSSDAEQAFANIAAGSKLGYIEIPGYGIVREKRDVILKDKRSKINFTDIAAYIDPTTVTMKSLTDPKTTKVIEQNFNYDLVSRDKLLQKYIDQEITVEQPKKDKGETIKGKLLTSGDGLILDSDGKIIIVNGSPNVVLPALPGGLITKPTLVWDVWTEKPGTHTIETSYETKGIAWWADYNLTYTDGKDENSGFLDIGSWVTIVNQTGATYQNSKLKLVAGDVNRAPQVRTFDRGMKALAAPAMGEAAPPGFAEKAFFEYHLYTLGHNVTLPDNSSKQIELFSKANKIPVLKTYVYQGAEIPYYGGIYNDAAYGAKPENSKVFTYLKFKNSAENGLGIPLPAGKIRVSKEDSDGSLEFIGEDRIDHTAKDQDLLIRLGNSFDLTGSRKQVNFKVDNSAKTMEETIEIKVANAKANDVTVLVRENLYRAAGWQIIQKSAGFKKINANTVEFPIKVAKGGEETIKYTVKYSW